MHPSVGLTIPRAVPLGGCQTAGQWFPGGLRVGINTAVVHFDKTIFGEDAERYNPERWFREDAVNMHRYMFQVPFSLSVMFSFTSAVARQTKRQFPVLTWNPRRQFGGGDRTCIGRNVSVR